MANCNNLFREFNSKIRLSKSKKESLRISRDNLRDKIRQDFSSDAEYNPVFMGQGSYTLDTIVNPINQGEFDIDDGIYFEVENEPNESPSTFHSWIYNAVEGYTDIVKDKNTCVRVLFSDGHHIDLTVYYKLPKILYGNHPYLAHKKNGWIKSDPQEFIKWFNNKLDKEKQLRRIVRYLKSWCDFKNLSGITGLILTILAAEKYVGNEKDDLALLETLKKIKGHLEITFSCFRPTTPCEEDLLKNCNENNKNDFMKALGNIIKSGEQAINTQNQKEACIKWKKHFGERFPCHLADEELEDAETFETPAILISDGRSA